MRRESTPNDGDDIRADREKENNSENPPNCRDAGQLVSDSVYLGYVQFPRRSSNFEELRVVDYFHVGIQRLEHPVIRHDGIYGWLWSHKPDFMILNSLLESQFFTARRDQSRITGSEKMAVFLILLGAHNAIIGAIRFHDGRTIPFDRNIRRGDDQTLYLAEY